MGIRSGDRTGAAAAGATGVEGTIGLADATGTGVGISRAEESISW
jgi:hypothetical protein